MHRFVLHFTASIACFCVCVLLVITPTKLAAQEEIHWGYEGEEGPDHWGELSPEFAVCSAGLEQSPIDIVAGEASPANLPDLAFNYQPTVLNIKNNGHTVQVDYDGGSSIEVDGETYNLLQFHFHTPSEHMIDGQLADMELHLVHQNSSGGLAVVGVLINIGSENPAFTPVWDHLLAEEGEESFDDVMINVDNLLPEGLLYYRYDGSLTTPPCSESVKWHVLTTSIELSQGQVDTFGDIFHNNNRPVLPLNGREVRVDVAEGGVTPVSPRGNLTTMWGKIKMR